MSHPHPTDPSSNVSYDPLPLTHEEHSGLYNTPPSPEPGASGFHTPLTHDDSLPLGASQPRFLGAAYYDETGAPRVRDSYASSHNTFPSGGNGSEFNSSVYALNDTQGLSHGYRDDPNFGEHGSVPMSPVGQGRFLEEKRATYAPPHAKSKRKIIIIAAIASLLLLVLAVVVPVYFAIVKPKSSNGTNAGDKSSSNDPATTTDKPGSPPPSRAAVTGGDGTKITAEDGSTFTYTNKFGGYWYWDENDPFHDAARAQYWTPALNETFKYGEDIIRGQVFFFTS
ncbi:hypothetical protein BD779DRAFT_841739 [Infundibulicybe gibba]|nr:hypothetical protein BD779DRAFT_841739 [Infundibulicybe gibba]